MHPFQNETIATNKTIILYNYTLTFSQPRFNGWYTYVLKDMIKVKTGKIERNKTILANTNFLSSNNLR
jgi:hypothetical protein